MDPNTDSDPIADLEEPTENGDGLPAGDEGTGFRDGDRPPAGIPGPDEEIVPDLLAHFEEAPMPDLAPAPSAEFLTEQFFSFDYLDGATPVERYWVDEPYAYVSVLFRHEADDYYYQVVEPELDEFESFLRQDLAAMLRDVLLYESLDDTSDDGRQRLMMERAVALIDEYAGDVDPGSLYKIQYYLKRDFVGYDRIDPLMNDRRIEDVSCDGTGVPVFAYHNEYRDIETSIAFEKEPLNSFVRAMAQRADKHVSVADPMVGGSLSDGSRVQLTLGEEVSNRGSNFTVRRFAEVPITPVDLIAWNTFSAETMAYLWLALENNMALLFTGGTASGKTTSLNAVSMFIPRNSKVISIEDTREITLPHDNWIQNTTRESFSRGDSSDIDMYELLQASLRHRPEYLLVGEIRTESDVALTFFQAMATGHTACTTFHADSIETVLSRLQNPPLQVPEQMIQELDIVCVQRQVQQGGTRVRRNTNISEMGEGDGLQRHQTYRWDPTSDEFDSQGESRKLESLRRSKGWSAARLRTELRQRADLLDSLVKADIRSYEQVSAVIDQFQRHPGVTLARVRNGEISEDGVPEPRVDGTPQTDTQEQR